MELSKEFKPLDGAVETEAFCEGFELDFQENLPQYLDDIERVVKCSVNCVVTDYECTGSMMKLYGKCIIGLTYFDGSGNALSNIFEEEFSKPLNTKVDSAEFADISLCTKYSNYRLVNQRRIDIHTSLRAEIHTYAADNGERLVACDEAFVKNYSPAQLCERGSGICSEDFDETFSVSDADSRIKNIINTFSDCVIEDKKIIKDKMLVKVNVRVSVLYETENGAAAKSQTAFTLSRIIDISSAGEDDVPFVTAAVSSLYVKAKADGSDRLTDIEAVGRVTFNYSLLYICTDDFIVDAYLPGCDTEFESKNISLKSQPILYRDDKSAELTFENDKSIIEILDLNAEITHCGVENAFLCASVKLSFLYYDESSQLCFYEKTADYKMQLTDAPLVGTASVNMTGYDYVIKNADTVQLRINFEYTAYLYSQSEISVLTDMTAQEKADSAPQPQLTLYFAHKGENVWDIAKKFSTAMPLIMEENDLTSQILDGQRVLLVPGM